MKLLINVLYYLWILLAIILVCFFVYYQMDVGKEKEFVTQLSEVEKEEALKECPGDDCNRLFALEGDIRESSINLATIYYKAIPWELRKDFVKEGWNLIITDKNINDEYYNGEIKRELAGLTLLKEKKIYISHKSRHIRQAMVHEFGHYLDIKLGFVSETKEFKEIYEEEKEHIKEKWKFDGHASSNSQEFFAECFANYECGKPNTLGKAMGIFLERNFK